MSSPLIHKNLIREIIKYGSQNHHPIIQNKINPQKRVDPEGLREKIATLKHTAAANGLISLSANQIMLNHRIFVILKKNLINYGQWKDYESLFLKKKPQQCYDAIINPQIMGHSNFKIKDDEQCSTIQGLKCKVWVPLSNQMAYLKQIQFFQRNKKNTSSFQKCEDKLTGFYGRVFDHQFRHLEGIIANRRQICNGQIYLTNQFKENPQNHDFLNQYRTEKQFFNDENMDKHIQRQKQRIKQLKERQKSSTLGNFNIDSIPDKIDAKLKLKLSSNSQITNIPTNIGQQVPSKEQKKGKSHPKKAQKWNKR